MGKPRTIRNEISATNYITSINEKSLKYDE